MFITFTFLPLPFLVYRSLPGGLGDSGDRDGKVLLFAFLCIERRETTELQRTFEIALEFLASSDWQLDGER